ncbi:MAG: Cysteine desulfurase [Alphaproteobacteria bacterium MarineAlpha5_Bin9]|nr:MAG: Cysteine desulfurase [Alphaproteobacteria bacterium MarineAlpha5_Bin9]|tara:strand:+ start:8096 stop:9301 length:1206 start_codon:yes stop_codon:yes gene_type:complete
MFENIKKEFPVFEKDPELVFLDTAASSLKPKIVIDEIMKCYSYEYANIHRGIYKLSSQLTTKYEENRKKIGKFINAESSENIIITKSATESINLVCSCFCQKYLKPGDEIIISHLEHHANIVPWQIASEKYGFKIIFVDINPSTGSLDLQDLKNKINENTKFISLTHMSNVTGSITDTETLNNYRKKYNIPLLLDGCQMVAHSPVDVKNLNCDFYVFSGHKLYGPSGIGVLYMKDKWFEKFEPYQGGGSMIDQVTTDKTTFAKGFQKFEAGTPPIVQLIGLGKSIDFVSSLNLVQIQKCEKELYNYAIEKLSKINKLNIIGHSKNKGGILSFTVQDIHPQDIALILDQKNIALRTGQHCAEPLHRKLKIDSTARASFGVYNSKNDVDKLHDGIINLINFFN